MARLLKHGWEVSTELNDGWLYSWTTFLIAKITRCARGCEFAPKAAITEDVPWRAAPKPTQQGT